MGQIFNACAAPPHTEAFRPPWSTEASVRVACTGCGACIAACPERILRAGRAGTPVVDFSLGACTFCGACVAACEEGVFHTDAVPWSLKARLNADCLLRRGVSCRVCTDACGPGALRFDMRAGPVGAIRVDPDLCTGCGACLTVCPAAAIDITRASSPESDR